MWPTAVFLSLLALSAALPQHARTPHGRKFHLDGRIVGGNETTIQKYPYMVSVRESFDEMFDSHECGGAIISENYVATAGHCCTGEDISSLVVRVGNTSADNGERHDLSQIILHPDYHMTDKVPYNDICLLKVSKPFTYSDSIKAVALPEANVEAAVGSVAVTTGWGSTYYGGDAVENLREVAVPIVSHLACVSSYGLNPDGENYVNNTMICAGYTQGGKDACQGDSGGPLAVSGTLVGLVSWGAGCAEPKYVGVYTDVAYFRDWIKSEAGI